MKIEDLLVPIDFSHNSLCALEFAMSLVEPGGEICLLHVIDADFVVRVQEEGFGEKENVMTTLRERAEARLLELVQTVPDPKPNMTSMVVVGKPFSEILRVAADLDYHMIVLGKRGRRGSDLEEVLFGSTAEKVIRTSRIPVVSVPASWSMEKE